MVWRAGEHNTVIRAWWTPHSLKLEQRVNLLDYDNVHQPPYRRCATFDGPENLSELKNLPNQARCNDTLTTRLLTYTLTTRPASPLLYDTLPTTPASPAPL